jgi:dienelactone hydrolase
MNHQTLVYQADGLVMRGELFFGHSGVSQAGVLVFPEAFGIGENSIARAKRLAAEGFVALACDLHGEGRFVNNLPEAMRLVGPLFDNPDRARARGLAAFNTLIARPEVNAARVGAIGFCFPMPMELARAGADIRAAVGFHTGLSTKGPAALPGTIKARILVCIGADDPYIPPDHRAAFEAEMRSASADWQINIYGKTVHSFTNSQAALRKMPDVIRYSPEADIRAWNAMRGLFAEAVS